MGFASFCLPLSPGSHPLLPLSFGRGGQQGRTGEILNLLWEQDATRGCCAHPEPPFPASATKTPSQMGPCPMPVAVPHQRTCLGSSPKGLSLVQTLHPAHSTWRQSWGAPILGNSAPPHRKRCPNVWWHTVTFSPRSLPCLEPALPLHRPFPPSAHTGDQPPTPQKNNPKKFLEVYRGFPSSRAPGVL